MANKEKGFYNHSANSITQEGPIHFMWEVEGIFIEKISKYIYGP